jgi:phosphoribosylglycinamide formyltransferase-1
MKHLLPNDKLPVVRLAWYVSGKAGRAIKALERYPELREMTCLVVNDEGPNNELSTLLSDNTIAYAEFNYKTLGIEGKARNTYVSNQLELLFKQHHIDYAFCFGSRLLEGHLLTAYKNRIINFHPSILPAFPGVKAIDQAMHAGAFLLGNTAHFIDEGMDTGPVIMQNIVHRTAFEGYDAILDLQVPMIRQIARWLIEDRITVHGRNVIISGAAHPEPVFYPRLESA